MTEKSILIIGAGVGGLSAGCYAQLNGYRVRILEMHNLPGGVCTAWRREGYTFDACIHNLAGTSPKSVFHKMWRELGVIPAIEMQTYDELVRVERPDGDPLIIYSDLDRLASHMKQISPDDATIIDKMVEAARCFSQFELMGLAAGDPGERLKALTKLPTLIKYGGSNLEQFANKFSDPFLRKAIPTLLYDGPPVPALLLVSFMGRLAIGDFGWPKGGSAKFSGAIAKHFEQLGGEISYDTRVVSILTEGNRAVGVRLANGEELCADIVISNAYGPTTIFDMLGGKYTNRAIRDHYETPVDRIEMGLHVSLGVDRDLPPEPHAIVLSLETSVMIAGEERDRFFVELFSFDKSMAPVKKSVLKVVFASSYKYWEELEKEPERYANEKENIVDAVIANLEPLFPGLREQVEFVDVATPMTTKRFTGKGRDYEASAKQMFKSMVTGTKLSQTLPRLDDFYMVGQSVGMPGIPMVAAMGRDVAKAICKKDGKPFVTS